MFTIEQSYYISYNFLSQYWNQIDQFRVYKSDDFTLSVVLSMRPAGLNIPNSSDPAKYEDWKEIVATKFTNHSQFTEADIFDLTIQFLKFHKDKFEFNLASVLADMESAQTQVIWRKVVDITTQAIADRSHENVVHYEKFYD